MLVEDYIKDVVCTFSYAGGVLNHKISFLVSGDVPFDMLLGMYYLEVDKPQFDWDKKVLKHELRNGRTVRLAKYKASRLIDSYGCLCAPTFYNYYKQNQEEGMYLFFVSKKGEAVKSPLEIENVVAKYPDLFEEPTGVVDREVVHAIKIIPGSKIPKGRIYRMAPAELDELRRQLKELTEKGWIRPSISRFGEGSLRMCIDQRGLDAITVKNAEPLPRIDNLLDRVHGYACEAAFKRLKYALTHHEILMVPDPERPFVVTTDASHYGIGAVLAQQEGKKLRPIEYMSKKMPSKKLAKSTYERELYALYKALVLSRHYLWGVIDQYDFKLDYVKGEYNKVVDALSRRADYLGALLTEFGLSDNVTRSLVEAYKEDPVMMDIMHKLEAQDKATSDEYVTVDGLLFLEKVGFKSTTDITPNQLHFGWKPRSALDFLLPENRTAAPPGTIEFGVQYEKLSLQTVEHIKKSQEAMIASENKHCRQSTFQVGERVLVRASELGQEFGISRKLMPSYFDPWEVLDIVGSDLDGPSYVIRIPGHLHTYPVFHASKLAPFAETAVSLKDINAAPTMDGHVDIDDILERKDMHVPKPAGRGRPPKPMRECRVRFRHHTNRKEDRWFTREELVKTTP
ncbi:hypothetical protein CBR_g81569 [Chara braunii]|uniref:Reverse transcriptase/retrotransposon-derived protein RNase H-like domain-containing protein n=1 Tax=Chara braunii TaxID=69332 RepID=A0A388KAQ4_CHABU|nr:hypothetical protein CBR_g81569 [Chara braunii]|eukprot:GBG67144.1 hypothetical protein CBR_g81569 [Chara braunii]